MAVKGTYVYEWPRPMVTTDALVFGFADDCIKMLLVQRAQPPFQGSWAVPGGFLEMDEDLAVSAARELYEETGLTGIELKELGTFGAPGRDPRGRVITVAFWGCCRFDEYFTQTRAGDDAAMAQWFNINALDEIDFGFDHRLIVECGINRLKESTEYAEFAKRTVK